MYRKNLGSHHAPPFTKKFVHQLDILIEIPNSQQQNRNPTRHGTYIHLFAYLQSTTDNQMKKEKIRDKGYSVNSPKSSTSTLN